MRWKSFIRMPNGKLGLDFPSPATALRPAAHQAEPALVESGGGSALQQLGGSFSSTSLVAVGSIGADGQMVMFPRRRSTPACE